MTSQNDMYAFASPISLTRASTKLNCVARFTCCERPPAKPVASTAAESNKTTIAESLAAQLRRDLPELFNTEGCPSHYDLFAEKVNFRDPLTSFEGVQPYRANIAFLRDSPVFERTKLDTFDVRVTSPKTVTTRWSMAMTVRVLPWRPRVKFTGESIYELNDDGKVIGHIDYWDSLSETANNSVVTKEAVADLVGQFTPQRHYQALGARPSFLLMRRMRDVEIRNYEDVTLVDDPTKMVAGGIAEVRRDGQFLGLSEADNTSLPVGIVATATLKPGASVEQCAKTIVEELRKSGIARPVESVSPLLVRYKKKNLWDSALFWQQPVQEVWVSVEQVDVDAGQF